MLLDEKKQPLFGLEVVVEPRQRHAAGARKIAHGSAFITLLAEDIGGVEQYFCQPLVVSRFGLSGWGGRSAMPCGNACCRGSTAHSQQPALIRTFVRISIPSGRLGLQELIAVHRLEDCGQSGCRDRAFVTGAIERGPAAVPSRTA